ncbi:acetyltransferase [Vibrio fluvialis]|nr:acetyltransferase [Vibrio fluvialis]MBY8086903.1 acetyltransferase [Vibrio fluvialis]MBY8103962.1 acetyltransferase [Vibrio fluvialis]
MCKNLIFVGSGGYFKELYDYLRDDLDNGRHAGLNLKGIVAEIVPSEDTPLPFLSLLNEYELQQDDLFLIVIGQSAARKRIFDYLANKGAQFLTYIHHTALVSKSASIGEGTIVCPYTVVNANALVGRNCSINVHCSIGHDSVLGEHTVVSPYSALNGHAKVGSNCFIGTRSTIFPKIEVGPLVTVDSHTTVRNNIESKMLVTSSIKTIATKNRFL